MGKHLVLVGGGHAHMMTLAALQNFVDDGHRVTVIAPSPYHYYSGMGPGMLGKTYTPDKIRFATRQVVEKKGGQFIHDSVERIDPVKKTLFLHSGDRVTYDVVSFNAGSQVTAMPTEGDAAGIFTVKPIERLLEAQQKIVAQSVSGEISVAVVGGGPSAAEIAGNIWALIRAAGSHTPKITIYAGTAMMGRFPARVKKKIVQILSRRGVRIIEKLRVINISGAAVETDDGQTHPADIVFLATGVKPSPIFTVSGLPTGPDGGLRVNTYLQSIAHENIFGGGDCIYFQDAPLDKVGVYAVRQNPVLLHNLDAALNGRKLMPFDPGGDYLLIFNVGGGMGVLRKRQFQVNGRIAFWIKDYIDRKFMKKFQAIQ
jgi:NADH dehydrogenase FAD-containing subunit